MFPKIVRIAMAAVDSSVAKVTAWSRCGGKLHNNNRIRQLAERDVTSELPV